MMIAYTYIPEQQKLSFSRILDDMGHEMEMAESKIDSTMKKMAKILRMSNDRRQWVAIGVLSALMIIVIILLIYL